MVNAKVSSSWHPDWGCRGKGLLYSAAEPQDVRRWLCCCAASAPALLPCCCCADMGQGADCKLWLSFLVQLASLLGYPASYLCPFISWWKGVSKKVRDPPPSNRFPKVPVLPLAGSLAAYLHATSSVTSHCIWLAVFVFSTGLLALAVHKVTDLLLVSRHPPYQSPM